MSPKGAEAPAVRGHAEEEREDRKDNFHYVRIRATEGAKLGDVWFPRVAVDANSVAVWLKLVRTCRYLGQHFFRRTEVLIVYIVGWFGCVFAFLWYLQLGTEVEALPQYVVALVMAALFIFWGGLFLCICASQGAAANNEYQQQILDLAWRKQEVLQRAAAVRDPTEGQRRRAAESSEAIDNTSAILQWSHETEHLAVFGVRLDHTTLMSMAVVTAGQILLFTQLIMRYYDVGLARYG